MKNDTSLWCPVGEGHGEGVFDQLGAHVFGQRPAHNSASGQVDDCGQVGPALPGCDVGDVADIAPVHLLAWPEVALDEIAAASARVGHGGLAPALLAPSLEAGLRISLVTLRLPRPRDDAGVLCGSAARHRCPWTRRGWP